MTRWNIHNTLYSLFHILFIGDPQAPWSTFLVWFVRAITISLLLRTYIAPWSLALMSKHIRARSISLRSIKGLYFRRGRWICRAERIGYVFGVVDGERHLTVRIDGLKIEMQKASEETKVKKRRHQRNLTLADLHPSPLAARLWGVVTKIALRLEPWLRPLIRTYVVACLRIGIQWLPAVTQALSFELRSTVFAVAQIPGTQVIADGINLHAALELTQVESVLDPAVVGSVPPQSDSWRFYGMAAWKRRMTESFQRALDIAWGRTRGTVTVSFKLSDVVGTTSIRQPQTGHERSRNFLLLPGAVALGGDLHFHAQTATVDANSIMLESKVEEIAMNVDLLNDILRAVIPPRVPPVFRSDVTPVSSPATPPSSLGEDESVGVDARTATKRSRSSTIFSSHFLPVSPTGSFLSLENRLLSPKSGASPFFKALSSSLSSRGRIFAQPSRRLKDINYKSPLSTIRSINIQVSVVALSFSSSVDEAISYKTSIKDLSADFHPSNTAKDHLHAQWLGRTPPQECFDAETYGLNLRVTTVKLERRKRGNTFPVITLGSIDFQAVFSQWPSPWLTSSSFMAGDPNAPFLAASLKIGGVELTDRLDDLRDFLQSQISKPRGPAPKEAMLAKIDGLQWPSCSMQVNCGAVCARVVCDTGRGQDSSTLEMRTNGFSFGLRANYYSCSVLPPDSSPPDSARLTSLFSFHLDPILLRVRSGWASVGYASDNEFLSDPAVLSIGAVEVTGDVVADAREELDMYRIVGASIFCRVHAIIDTFCIELWHAASVSAVVHLLGMLPTNSQAPVITETESPTSLSFPPGIRASISLARFIVVITAPDINPKETDLSRGVGIRTLVSLELYALNSKQIHHIEDLKRAELRAKLRLAPERSTDIIAVSKESDDLKDVFALARLTLRDLVIRSAVATQFESDDPFLAGRDDLYPTEQEFVRVETVNTDFSFVSSSDETISSNPGRISVDIPLVQGNFQLGSVYSALLALQTLQTLAKVRPPSYTHDTQESCVSRWSTQCRIHTVHFFWALPNKAVISRLEDVSFNLLPGRTVHTHFTSLVFWVPLSVSVDKWKHDLDPKWDELLTLHQWDITLPVADHSVSVAAKGDSLRLRIPYGYVLADLLLDVTVVAKAIKHLGHIVKSGVFTNLPIPESEGPKLTPNMTFDVRHFCIEAIDDPFEAKLGAIWKVGLEAVKQRLEREEAFGAKVAAIKATANRPDAETGVERDHDYRFTARHTVPVEDARRRLDEVHFLDWKFRLQNLTTAWSRQEKMLLHRLYGPHATSGKSPFPKSEVAVDPEAPPLFRVLITSLSLSVSLPSFPLDKMRDLLHEQGKGLPRETEFSLLIPLHINFTLNSFRITVRDYPIPLLHIQGAATSRSPACTFDSDVVVAEEMGSEFSVDWVECPVIAENQGLQGTAPLMLHVPKTIMPVKSYACPDIHISTSCPTILSWGVSYNPTIQDIVKVIETLTPNPRDPSPPIGFWDKLRLVAHWRIRFLFQGEVRCYLKGSRSPVHVNDNGAGFVLVWKGAPQLLIGHPNDQREIFEVTSDMMLIAIPRFGEPASDGVLNLTQSSANPYRKICAELHSGVRYGIGFVFERTCDAECPSCHGTAFQRQCRIFNFLPHYAIKLEIKPNKHTTKEVDDSYRGFRSDFIHFSFSLAASTKTPQSATNALHLTPKAFAHFWAWCSLFDSIPTLRIRVGTYFPPRTITPKFGRHIATIKYRITLTKLFVMHGYIDDSRETWTDGITPWIGVKGMADELRVDMHQRDQETKVRGVDPDTTKMARRKPFYAAEVVLKGLDLQTILATFDEPLKTEIPMVTFPQTSNYRKYEDLPRTSLSSSWYNVHDFIELDWSSPAEPVLHCIPLATCPRFTYFKRNAATSGDKEGNKFGIEPTHLCLLGQEPSAPQVQIALAAARIEELKQDIPQNHSSEASQPQAKMMGLLQDYIDFLANAETDMKSDRPGTHNYHIPSEVVLPEEWAEFDHVYQLHCLNLSIDKATRDIMIQYYHHSGERKGFEYHMAARAVKFIRDQARATRVLADPGGKEQRHNSINTAQLAATAIRKMLRGDGGKTSIEVDQQENLGLQTDPLDGWADGVTVQKAHCCFLLKPQVVLKGEGSADACVVAAVQAKMQSFAIMDKTNIGDPISGKIMSRSYTALSGLQTFSPVCAVPQDRLRVPLEVLIDLRCESDEFERLVPQTDATFHYDKFNRLRLRNEVTSEPPVPSSLDKTTCASHNHLQDQTDLIRVHIPHFTVSASDKHFQTISNIVTKLLLFSDATYKARLDKLETLLFTYDFTNLSQAADVVVNLQGRLRAALETEKMAEQDPRQLLGEEDAKIGRLRLRAHMIMLSEELNYLFDAIKLAQDRTDGRMDQKSALLLHASSSELSWRMLGEDRDLLAKLVVQHSNFYWLSRQDSAMVNDLVIGNLQAFDGSRSAIWTEILSKHDEPANHPLHKRNLFLLAHWTMLPPVGGISIYETFEVSLHPLKLQIDAKVGRRIMEYLWPDRRHRQQVIEDTPQSDELLPQPEMHIRRTSLDSPRALHNLPEDTVTHNSGLVPPLRKLTASRSFTDLRSTRDAEPHNSHLFSFPGGSRSPDMPGNVTPRQRADSGLVSEERVGDAAVMKTRFSQKTFIFVKISSMNLILSIVKEGSFECHDVRIKTRDLVYRNQTSSFEELVNQFIPSNMNWKGWVKMVFHQPLIPVFPVAREILSKTKWVGSSKVIQNAETSQGSHPGREVGKKHVLALHLGSTNKSFHSKWSRKSNRQRPGAPIHSSQPLTTEPEPDEVGVVEGHQKRGFNILHRHEHP